MQLTSFTRHRYITLRFGLRLGLAILIAARAVVAVGQATEPVAGRGIKPVKGERTRGSRRAVVIGISEYKYLPTENRLQFANADADLVAAYLRSPAGGSLGGASIRLLRDSAATAGAIWEQLSWLQHESRRGDTAIVYFAGHGDVEEASGDSIGQLLAYDAPVGRNYNAGGAISLDLLQRFAAHMAQRGVRVVVITDACRSGKLVGTMEGAHLTTEALHAEWANVIKMVSSMPDQLSQEGTAWGGGHGVFTYYLIDGLLGAADHDTNQVVRGIDILIYLGRTVPAATHGSQTPDIIGDKRTPIGLVDTVSRGLVMHVRPLSDTANGVALASRARGLSRPRSDDVTAFRQAIRAGHLVRPLGASAWDVLQRVQRRRAPDSLRRALTREFIGAAQDDGQEVIASYLNGGNDPPTPARSREAADALRIATNLLGLSDPLSRSLRARGTFLEGYAYYRQARPAEAIPFIERSLKLGRTAYALNGLGASLVNLNRLDTAELVLHEAARLAPHWAFPQNNLGVLEFRRRRYEAASEAFQHALQADPHYGKAYANMGRALYLAGRTAAADSVWRLAMAADPENTAALLADFFLQRHDSVKAESLYHAAIAVKPTSSLTFVRLGDFYRNLHRLDEAERAYRDAARVDSTFALAHSGIGALLVDRFDASESHASPARDSSGLDSAIVRFRTASRLAPEEPVFVRNLGIVLTRRRQYLAADTALRTALRLDTLDATSYWALGWLEQQRRQFSAAERTLRRGLALGSGDPTLHVTLGEVLEQRGKLKEAEATFHRALAIDSTSADARAGLARVQQRRARAPR